MESETYETEDNTDDDERNTEGTDSDASGATEEIEKKEDAKRKTALLKRKKKALESKIKPKKIKKDDENDKLKKEKKKSSKEKDGKNDSTEAGEKKELPDFSDKNVDFNLYHDDPQKVNLKRIKISDSVIVSCKMIQVNQRQSNSFEYPAIVFARKGRTDKAFEYNLPLNLAPKVIAALNIIVKENPKFFQSFENSSTATKKLDC